MGVAHIDGDRACGPTGPNCGYSRCTPAACVTIIPLEGKTVVDSPRHIASGEVAYDGELFFGRVGANYMSRRYYSYLN